jgi:hypothetical protein
MLFRMRQQVRPFLALAALGLAAVLGLAALATLGFAALATFGLAAALGLATLAAFGFFSPAGFAALGFLGLAAALGFLTFSPAGFAAFLTFLGLAAFWLLHFLGLLCFLRANAEASRSSSALGLFQRAILNTCTKSKFQVSVDGLLIFANVEVLSDVLEDSLTA